MERRDLIQQCKYYKGEEDSPYQSTKKALWNWELAWVSFSTDRRKGSVFLSRCLDEYMSCGLGDFEKFDDVPITLKALLFNRFEQWDEGGGFKEFYKKYYSK